MALILAKAFGTSAALWLNLQKNWELSQADPAVAGRIRPLKIGA
jgi:plasmid maintenance system antidote protein VapI